MSTNPRDTTDTTDLSDITEAPHPATPDMTGVLVGFVRTLRDADVAASTADAAAYCEAVAHLDPADVLDVYWAGRSTLVTRKEHIPIYDAAFRSYFLDAPLEDHNDQRHTMRAAMSESATIELPDSEQDGTGDDPTQLGLAASTVDVHRTKSFGDCTPEELAALRKIIRQMRLTPPLRRTRRGRPSASGSKVDMRRTARAAIRTHGEIDAITFRERQLKPRRLVILLDVSGSMADYSRHMLQFAYSSRRAAGDVEVFCFGTRLTRITPALDRRQPDEAMRQAAQVVTDWDGGTKIGASLDDFVRRFGRRGLSRGAVVVICSDGLDRGDPQVLDDALRRLSRQCHRIVWVTPHRGDSPVFTPVTVGMKVAAPYLDVIAGGHNLESLQEFAALLPTLR